MICNWTAVLLSTWLEHWHRTISSSRIWSPLGWTGEDTSTQPNPIMIFWFHGCRTGRRTRSILEMKSFLEYLLCLEGAPLRTTAFIKGPSREQSNWFGGCNLFKVSRKYSNFVIWLSHTRIQIGQSKSSLSRWLSEYCLAIERLQ